jgi:hypothetical protein
MMLDIQNLVSDQQTIAAVASTLTSTNAIDLMGAAAAPTLPQAATPAGGAATGNGLKVMMDAGRGKEPELLVQVTEAVTSLGSATVQFQLVAADDAALSTNANVLQETLAIAKADLVAGYQARLCIPPGIVNSAGNPARYLGCKYVIGTATTTAGKVTAGIVYDKQTTFVG